MVKFEGEIMVVASRHGECCGKGVNWFATRTVNVLEMYQGGGIRFSTSLPGGSGIGIKYLSKLFAKSVYTC